ncbi:MAG: nitroreductase family protein [Clostridiaceae bacterium]
MDALELMKARHSVRSYNDRQIDKEILSILKSVIDNCNNESGLNIQLCLNEPKAFNSLRGRLGKFRNASNYIALAGENSKNMEEKVGYYGQKFVLKATELGLGTCWVGNSYSKRKCGYKPKNGEKLYCVITFGYYDKGGVPHKTKSIEELSQVNGFIPDWFIKGMEAVQLAPTALNQQKFEISLKGNTVIVKPGFGVSTKINLGIVKYHFELGAGNSNWTWGE